MSNETRWPNRVIKKYFIDFQDNLFSFRIFFYRTNTPEAMAPFELILPRMEKASDFSVFSFFPLCAFSHARFRVTVGR